MTDDALYRERVSSHKTDSRDDIPRPGVRRGGGYRLGTQKRGIDDFSTRSP